MNFIFTTAWSIAINTTYFNVKFPDGFTTYQTTLTSITPTDVITIHAEIPYVRYFSYQVYDSNFVSLGSVSDYNLLSDGINCYSDSCVENTTMTSIWLQITKNKDGVDNPNVIYLDSNETWFAIVYRIYDVMDNINNEKSCEFGWIHPPRIFKNKNEISLASSQLQYPLYTTVYDLLPTYESIVLANVDDNFYKADTTGFANNEDADYLASVIEYNNTHHFGAIVSGMLPITSNSIYQSPKIGYISPYNTNISMEHDDYYEVRYISLNMGIRSPPENTLAGDGHPTIRDVDILNHYQYSQDDKERKYKIYIGATVDDIKRLGGNPKKDLYLLYPQIEGMVYRYLTLIYREVLSQTALLGKYRSIYKQGIADIESTPAMPDECIKTMGKYYPRIKFIKL